MYHVTSTPWDGTDLVCRADQADPAPWKWEADQEGLDTDVVCLFESRDEAAEFAAEFAPNGDILTVTLPERPREVNIMVTRVDEGYPAVFGRIPAEYVDRA